jgi:hypothetical protein
MTECAKCAEHQARREQAERRAGEMEARYDRLTLTVARLHAEAAQWRAVFVKYAESVQVQEGYFFLHASDFTPEEWAAITALPGMERPV